MTDYAGCRYIGQKRPHIVGHLEDVDRSDNWVIFASAGTRSSEERADPAANGLQNRNWQ